MNYFAVAKSALLKNMRKYMMFLCTNTLSLALYFLYTTLVYNNGTIIDQENNLFGMFLKSSICIIILILSSFTVYSYTSYIRLRAKEFKIMLRIGMTKRELMLCVLFENLILTAVSFAAGILLGTIFSKIFFLAVMSYLGFTKTRFSLGLINYGATVLFFVIIYFIITMRTRKILNKMDIRSGGSHRKFALRRGNLITVIPFLLLAAYDVFAFLKKQQGAFVWVACMLPLYAIVFFGSGIAAYVLKRKSFFYRGDFLMLKQLVKTLEKDRFFIFILAFTSFLFITYNGLMQAGVINSLPYGITQNEMKLFRVVSFFVNFTFFAISSGITYFKCQMEFEQTCNYFDKLYLIGLTKKELDRIIRYRLLSIFFIPCTLCAVTGTVFALVIGINMRFATIIGLSYLFQFYGYNKARRLYGEYRPV